MPDPSAPLTAISDLRQWPHWVLWRTLERDGKPTKVPFQPSGRPASSTDPGTWATHAEVSSVAARGLYEGVGYVFAADDEYAGVDLDKCVTDDQVVPEAKSVVDRLDSYTELSPTGTGLHVIVRGRINGNRNRTKKTPWGGDFESYDQARFFTITEQHLDGTPETIEPRQAELDAIRAELLPEPKEPNPKPSANGNASVPGNDNELLEKMFAAKNGARVQALYRGDTGAYDDDESSADLALCNSLAFWTARDAARMDRLFRSSGLMRDKWDSERPGGTYGSQTIDKAIESCREAYGDRVSLTRIFAERDRPRKTACDDLADLFGLKDVGDTFTHGVRSTRDSRGVVDLYTADSRHLHLAPLSNYSTAPKMAVEVGLQLGTQAHLKDAMPTVFALIGAICDLQEEVTFEERAADLARTYIQEAPCGDVNMTDQGEKWAAFLALKAKDPIVAAKANGTSIATESLVLRDTSSGLRYVRIGWFAAYVKAAGEDREAVRRMSTLGWKKAGDGWRGRIKATDPAGDRSLQWDFFTVPEGWEWS